MKVSGRAQGIATVVGTVVGTTGYFLHLGEHVWPAHPGWGLALVTVAVTFLAMWLASADARDEERRKKARGA